MITNYKINQPFTSNFSVEEGEENSSRTWNHGAGRIANSAWFITILYFGKRGRENQRRDETQCPSAQQQQQVGWSTSSQARKRRKSVHLQVLQILHILCFTVVNSETETHCFLVQFLNSPSEYMNQKRQVFEFLIQGALSPVQTVMIVNDSRCRW